MSAGGEGLKCKVGAGYNALYLLTSCMKIDWLFWSVNILPVLCNSIYLQIKVFSHQC